MGDMVDMAHAAERALAQGDEVVLVYEHYRHPTIIWETPATLDMRWIDNHGVLYPASGGRPVTVLFPLQDTPISEAALAELQAQGAPAIGQVRLSGTQAAPLAARSTLAGELALADADVPRTAPRNQPLQVKVRLAVLRPVAEARNLAAHLVDAQGQVWAQDDHLSYLSAEWRVGDRWVQWLTFQLDPAIPPVTMRSACSSRIARPIRCRCSTRRAARKRSLWRSAASRSCPRAG
jgi:hypothetical protein